MRHKRLLTNDRSQFKNESFFRPASQSIQRSRKIRLLGYSWVGVLACVLLIPLWFGTATPAQEEEPQWITSTLPGGSLSGVESFDIDPEESRNNSEDTQQVVVAGNQVYYSDRGEAWRTNEGPVQIEHILSTSDGNVFVQEREGRDWISRNFNTDWRTYRVLSGERARVLAVSENFSDDEQAFAISRDSWRLFRYDDNSQKWIDVSLARGESHEVAAAGFSPQVSSDEVMFVGSDQGVHRSDNSGQKWELVGDGAQGAPVFGSESGELTQQGLVIPIEFGDDPYARDDIRDSSIFAYNDKGVFHSDDLGATWERLNLDSSNIRDLAVSNAWPRDPVLIAALADPGYIGAVSQDGGKSWTKIEGPAGIAGTGAAVARDFGVPGVDVQYEEDTIDWIFMPYMLKEQLAGYVEPFLGSREAYISTDGDGLWTTNDAGRSWDRELTRTGLHATTVHHIAFLPGTEGKGAVAGSEAAGLYRSSDGGQNWSLIENAVSRGAGQMVNRIAVSPNYSKDGTIFVATTDGLRISRDEGKSWASGMSGSIDALVVSKNFESDGIVIADGQISHDGGQQWTPLDTPGDFRWTAAGISPKFAEDQTIWAGLDIPEDHEQFDSRLFVSTDAGANWEMVDSSLFRDEITVVDALSVAADPLRIFVGTEDGLVASEDGGKRWSRPARTPRDRVHAIESHIVQSPSFTAVVAVSGSDFVSWSTDRGDDWVKSPTDFEGFTGLSLSEDGQSILASQITGTRRYDGVFAEEE